MKMPGGGPHQIGPGQITDDSEMALCLMRGIVEPNFEKSDEDERVLNMDSVAYQYSKWMKSGPFDIDQAVQISLDALSQGAKAHKAQ